MTNSISEKVQDHYEDLPYPYRKAEDELQRIVTIRTSCLDYMNHTYYNGGKDFTKPYRVLIVGGGTGDIDVFWAENLRHNETAEIFSIDLSAASQKISKERLKIRGIDGKVTYIQDSLFNLPKYNLGEFDFITCTGVLHHTHDPELGLKILADMTKQDGVLDIMLYGKHGRYGIYPLQELIRHANTGITDKQTKIDNAWKILKTLPQSNYFTHNLKDMASLSNPNDFYDLLLHDQDRAYSVPEIYDFAASANLKIVEFFSMNGQEARNDYLPEKYINDAEMRKNVSQLPLKTRQTMAEILNSKMKMHFFSLSRVERQPLKLDYDLIPDYAMRLDKDASKIFYQTIANSAGTVTTQTKPVQLQFPKTPHLAEIFKNIDGERTVRQIFEKVIATSPQAPTQEQLMQEFLPIYQIFNNQYWLFLRQPHITRFTNKADYQARVQQNP